MKLDLTGSISASQAQKVSEDAHTARLQAILAEWEDHKWPHLMEKIRQTAAARRFELSVEQVPSPIFEALCDLGYHCANTMLGTTNICWEPQK